MKFIYKSIGVWAVLAGALGASYLFAWTGPTATPPGNNISAPVNVSATGQTKSGDLTVSGGLTGGTLLSTGAAQFNSYVGILKTPNASYALDISGNANATQLCIAGDCKSAWPSGGSGSPGGSNTQVQFNNSGSFGGSANFTWDNSANRVTVTNLRVSGVGSCSASNQLLQLNASGDVICGTDDGGAGGGGTVTSITAGTGLTGGTITTSGTIAADTTYLQRRVSSTCAAGSSIRVINSDGTVTCETDDGGAGGGGTVTSITAGTGLTGGTITTSGTVGLSSTGVTASSYTNANITVDAQGRITSASNGSGTIGGSGSSGYVPRFTGVTTLGNSSIQDNGSGNVSIGTGPDASYKLKVNGNIYAAYSASNYVYMNTGGLIATGGFAAPIMCALVGGVIDSHCSAPQNVSTLAAISLDNMIYSSSNSNYYLDPKGITTLKYLIMSDYMIFRRTGNLSSHTYDRQVQVNAADGNMWFSNGANIAMLTYAGQWQNASDVAYKKNIRTITDGLDTLLKLKPRRYELKDTGEKQVGFVAQEVETVVPEVVSGADGKKTLSYGQLTSIITAAVQELAAKFNNHDREITQLKEQVSSQEQQIQALRQELEALRNP